MDSPQVSNILQFITFIIQEIEILWIKYDLKGEKISL